MMVVAEALPRSDRGGRAGVHQAMDHRPVAEDPGQLHRRRAWSGPSLASSVLMALLSPLGHQDQDDARSAVPAPIDHQANAARLHERRAAEVALEHGRKIISEGERPSIDVARG